MSPTDDLDKIDKALQHFGLTLCRITIPNIVDEQWFRIKNYYNRVPQNETGESLLTTYKSTKEGRQRTISSFAVTQKDIGAILKAGRLVPSSVPLADCGFSSTRIRKMFVRLGLHTLADLIALSADEIFSRLKARGRTVNFGVSSMNELRDNLSCMELKLKGE